MCCGGSPLTKQYKCPLDLEGRKEMEQRRSGEGRS